MSLFADQDNRHGPKIVMKFGGSSVAEAENVKQCASIVIDYNEKNSLVVVCSAIGETTDELLRAADFAKTSGFDKAKEALHQIKETHLRIISGAIQSPSLSDEAVSFVDAQLAKLDRMLYGISLLKDISPRSLDVVLSFGEQLSTKILSCVLASRGLKTKYLTGGEAGIVTNDAFGSASPLIRQTEANLREKLVPLLDKGIIPVVAGFIAETLEDRQIITLGRGGSDYTASLVAAAIDASEVILWTDVDGILTADPRLVGNAKIVGQVTYLEAMEMSAFGAKSMQPRALEPVALRNIPVRIKNTFRPKSEGTTIVSPERISNGGHFQIKCIGSLTDVAIVGLSGASVVGQPGTALVIFEILKELGVNLLMISQSVSESNVSLVIKKKDLSKVVRTLKERLLHYAQDEIPTHQHAAARKISGSSVGSESVFAKLEYEDDVAVIAVLGSGMMGIPGIAGRVFSTVAKEGINVRMIAQGSSEINISFVIKEKERTKAVTSLHEEFHLGETNYKKIDDQQQPATKIFAS